MLCNFDVAVKCAKHAYGDVDGFPKTNASLLGCCAPGLILCLHSCFLQLVQAFEQSSFFIVRI